MGNLFKNIFFCSWLAKFMVEKLLCHTGVLYTKFDDAHFTKCIIELTRHIRQYFLAVLLYAHTHTHDDLGSSNDIHASVVSCPRPLCCWVTLGVVGLINHKPHPFPCTSSLLYAHTHTHDDLGSSNDIHAPVVSCPHPLFLGNTRTHAHTHTHTNTHTHLDLCMSTLLLRY